jgi:GNAT superfamily N-acetyltransferase
MRQDQIVEVRPARVADAAKIAAIHIASWQRGYRGLVPQDYLDGLDAAVWTTRRVNLLEQLDWSRSGCFVVADNNGELVGFTHAGPTRDDDSSSSATAAVGEVYAIYLAPDAWGKGFGQALMAAALAQLAQCGYGEATLWVLDSNARARRFYAAAGFKPDGAVKVDDSRGFPLAEVRYRRSLR